LISRTILTVGSGVYATPEDTRFLIFKATGAGAGAGGITLVVPGIAVTGGGASGEYAELTVNSPEAQYNWVVGAGSAGGIGGGAGAGGDTTVDDSTGQILKAQGGRGGPGAAAPAVADGAVLGAANYPPGAGYDFATGTRQGESGFILGGLAFGISGRGGHSFYGSGGDPVILGNGLNGAVPGGGGGGAVANPGPAVLNGGNGGDGMLIVEAYA